MSKNINILLFSDGKKERLCIPKTNEAIWEKIGDYYEVIRISDDYYLLCDENGSYKKDLPVNMILIYPTQGVPIVGNCFICKDAGEEFGSLSDEDYEIIEKHLRYNETKKTFSFYVNFGSEAQYENIDVLAFENGEKKHLNILNTYDAVTDVLGDDYQAIRISEDYIILTKEKALQKNPSPFKVNPSVELMLVLLREDIPICGKCFIARFQGGRLHSLTEEDFRKLEVRLQFNERDRFHALLVNFDYIEDLDG